MWTHLDPVHIWFGVSRDLAVKGRRLVDLDGDVMHLHAELRWGFPSAAGILGHTEHGTTLRHAELVEGPDGENAGIFQEDFRDGQGGFLVDGLDLEISGWLDLHPFPEPLNVWGGVASVLDLHPGGRLKYGEHGIILGLWQQSTSHPLFVFSFLLKIVNLRFPVLNVKSVYKYTIFLLVYMQFELFNILTKM